MKKILKGFSALALIAFASLFTYANLRQPSLTEQVEPVHLKIFSLGRVASVPELQAVREAVEQVPGVTAASFGKDAETFSVTYLPDQCDAQRLLAAARLNGNFEATEKTFPPRPACPVPPLYGLKRDVLNALRIF